MPDYDLGTARGKVVVDYKDHGAKAAAHSLDYLRNVGSRLANQFKSLNSSMEGSKAGFLHVRDGAHGAELAVRGLAQALAALDDTMNVVERRVIGFGKIMGNRLLDTNRIAGDLSIALRGVPKELSYLPKEAKNFIRLSGAIGTAVFATNLLRKRTETLARTLSFGGRLPGVVAGVTGLAAAFDRVGLGIDNLKSKNIVIDKLIGGITKAGTASYGATNKITSFALAASSLISVSKSLHQFEKLQRRISKYVGLGFTALGSGIALLQPTLSVVSTAMLGTWDAAKQLAGGLAILPGAIFSLGVPIGVALAGFKGLTDAFSLAFSTGDDAAEKLEEALGKIAPNAADMVRAVREVAPAWSDAQKAIQNNLFEGSADGLRTLSENYLPLANEQLTKVASGLNDIGSGFARFANQPRTIELIGEGFSLVADMLSNVGDSFTPFLEGMREVGIIGTRHLAAYSKGLEGVARRFSNFTRSQAGADKINNWITDSVRGFGDLISATRNVAKGIGNVLRPFAKGDFNNALESLNGLTKRFAEFTDPVNKGGKAIKAFADRLETMAGPWKRTLGTIFGELGDAFAKLSPKMESVSEKIANAVNTFAKVFGPVLEVVAGFVAKMSNELASLAIAIFAARAALLSFKALRTILGPMFAVINGIQAVKRAFGSTRNTLAAFNNIMDNTERKARGNFISRGFKAMTAPVVAFGKAAEDSAKKTSVAVGSMRDSVRSLGLGGTLKGGAGGAAAGIGVMASALADSARYARQANPQLGAFATMTKVVRENMTSASRAIKDTGEKIRESGSTIRSAGVSMLNFNAHAETAAEGAKKSGEAIRGAVPKDTPNLFNRYVDGYARASARIETSVVNAGRSMRSSIPSFRDVGSAAKSAGASMGSAVRSAALFPGVMAQSMKYAKQAAPEMGAVSRAARVLQANFTGAASAGKAFNSQSMTMGSVIGSGVSKAMNGAKSAAGGLLGVLGGPWGAVFMAATAAGADFVIQNQRVAASNRAIEESAQQAVKTQRDLQVALSLSGGKSNDTTVEKSQDLVRSKIEQTGQSAQKATGMLQGLAKFGNNVLKMSYEEMAEKADKATNSFNKNGWEGQMAAKRQQALNDALAATGMTMDEAVAAFAKGGPELDRLQAALRSTGGAGNAVIAEMSGVKSVIDGTAESVGEMGPRAAALGAAMSIITDAASSAEDKLNAMRVALQSLGLMQDANFDAAAQVAEGIEQLTSAATGATTAVDAMGNEFLNADGTLNPFHASARNVNNALADLRERLLAADPGEAMAMFEKAQPALEAMRRELGLSEEAWGKITTEMGLIPKSIETQVRIANMDETQGALFAVNEQIKMADGKVARMKVTALTDEAVAALQKAGFMVEEYDAKTGEAYITAQNADAVAKINETVEQFQRISALRAEGKLDVDNYGVVTGVGESAAAIASVNGFYGEGLIDVNETPIPPKITMADQMIASVNAMSGIGMIDVVDAGIASKVAMAQSVINSLRGKTVYIDVIQRANLGPLPGGAGTLASAAGATGGRFKGDYFNRLPGHAKGARHKGYQLPRTGPGTDIVDGFLALNHLGAPVARLDKEEWVINGKSSRKWNRLLAAINRDDPRLKYLPAFAEGGMTGNIRSQIGQIQSVTQVVTAQLNLDANAAQIEAAAAMLGQISSEEFASKFGKGIADGLNLGSRDFFVDQGRQYSEQLGIVFGKAAQDANDRLQKEIDEIEDKNLKEQKRKLLKSTEELQEIADREMMEWVNNNQFEVMGYTMAKSFAEGVSSGQNLLQAGIGALGQAATVALAAAGAPGIVAALAVTALKGLFDAFSDPDLWADGLFEGIYKIIDRMLAGLVTMVLDVLRNLFLMIGIDLAKAPIIGGLFAIKDAANGASKAVSDLMSDLEALNKLEYKNLGKTGATTIDAAIEAQLGNRVLAAAGAPAALSAPSGPTIGTLNVSAPDDKASSIIEAATFEMKRV